MSTHTPGPWRRVAYEGGWDGVAHSDGGPHIALICKLVENNPANASLIAAAPELLAALRFILAFYEPGQRHLDTEAWKVAEASAHAAVAKAEGRWSTP